MTDYCEATTSSSGNNLGVNRSVVEAYLEWNDRIFDRYFPIAQTETVRILSFDDSELGAVATSMGVPRSDFVASIRELINRDNPNPFSWWSREARGSMSDRDPPYYVALLALFSLAASESGREVDGQRLFFHRRLGQLLGLNDVHFVPGFAEATSLYAELDEYLRVKCGGQRGRLLLARNTFGGKYVWRARAQVLLNASSKRQLVSYFNLRCSNFGELSKKQLGEMLLAEVTEGDYALSPALKHTIITVLSENDHLFDGFLDLIETEYIRWYLDKDDAIGRVGATEPPHIRSTAPNMIIEAVARVASTGRVRLKRSWEKRLVLRSALNPLPWHIFVQLRAAGAEWQNADRVAFSWNEGAVTFQLPDGAMASISLDDTLLFANDGSGWVITNKLRAGDLCAVACERATALSIRDAFAEMPGSEPIVRECAEISQIAIVTATAPHAGVSGIPQALRQLLAPDEARVTFRRGLRLGAGYLQAAPPRVVFEHPTIEKAAVSLDGTPLQFAATRRQEYPLPSTLSLGSHSIEVLGVCRSFNLTDTIVRSTLDPYDSYGFELCSARGVAIPVRCPGETSTSDYRNAHAVIVVGGLLL